MEICATCQKQNPKDARFCDACGAMLTKDTPDDTDFDGFATVVSSPTPAPAAPHPASAAFLVIFRGDTAGARFNLDEKESLIGRWDADNGIFPEIDLDKHDPEAKVSRRHARILFKDGNFYVEDLGSTNGTFLNRSRRLLPGVPQVLSEDDEIIVGKTFLRFKTTV